MRVCFPTSSCCKKYSFVPLQPNNTLYDQVDNADFHIDALHALGYSCAFAARPAPKVSVGWGYELLKRERHCSPENCDACFALEARSKAVMILYSKGWNVVNKQVLGLLRL